MISLHVGLSVADEEMVMPGGRRRSGCVDTGATPMLESGCLIYWVGGEDLAHCVKIGRAYQSWNSSFGTSWYYMGEYMLDNTVAGSGDTVFVTL